MLTLSSALQNAHAGPVQIPAWFVQMELENQTLRLTSHDTVTWNGETWTAVNMDVSSLRVGALTISGTLVLGNVDDAFGQVVLTDNPSDRPITIWGYDAGIPSLAAGDPVLVAEGVGAGCDIMDDYVRIGVRDPSEFRTGPRAIVSKAYGFNTLLPAGQTLVINGVSFTVTRGR